MESLVFQKDPHFVIPKKRDMGLFKISDIEYNRDYVFSY